MSQDAFDAWIAGLESRHFAELTFPEVSRALRALSSTYVERRQKLSEGAALAGAGKRAAFALFYAPLHYLLVEHIVAHLDGAARTAPTLVDLGCGTGASGVAWARAFSAAPRVVAIDRHPWAVGEATDDVSRIRRRRHGSPRRHRHHSSAGRPGRDTRGVHDERIDRRLARRSDAAPDRARGTRRSRARRRAARRRRGAVVAAMAAGVRVGRRPRG